MIGVEINGPKPKQLGTPEDFERAKKFIEENSSGWVPETTPKYKQDALLNRVYVGAAAMNGHVFDLYCYWTELERTVIARYGDEEEQYISGVGLAHEHPPLNAAIQLGIKAGIIPWEIAYPVVLREAVAKNGIAVLHVVEEVVQADFEENCVELEGKPIDDVLMKGLANNFRTIWARMFSYGLVKEVVPGFYYSADRTGISFNWDDPRLSNVEGSLR